MPKPRKTRAAKPSAPKPGGSRSNRIRNLILGVAAAVLAVELFLFFKEKAAVPPDLPVQVVSEITSEGTLAGPFRAWDLASWGDRLALTDPGNKRILVLDRAGALLQEIGEKQAGPPPVRELSCLSYDPQGNLVVMDAWNGLIRVFDPKGAPLSKIDLGNKGFYGPRGVAFDSGNYLVADTGTHRLVKVAPDGTILSAWGSRGKGKGQFDNPIQVRTGPDGNAYVLDQDNSRVQCLDPQGKVVRVFGVSERPNAEALDPVRKFLYVSSLNSRVIEVFDLEGKPVGRLKASNQPDPIPGAEALCVLENGDLAAAHGEKISIYRSAGTVSRNP